jgi:nucleotide-binding universal stress UspA family protein
MIYQNIMVAVDGSDTSIFALKEAIQMAENFDSNLMIVHVFNASLISYTKVRIDYDQLIDSFRKEGQRILNKVDEVVGKSNIPFKCRLVAMKPSDGRVAEKIVAEANAWPADLLVLGTRGRHELKRLFLGSVAEGVSRIATMPLLLYSW